MHRPASCIARKRTRDSVPANADLNHRRNTMDILETIKSSLSSAQISTVANRIGESPEATGKAMAGALPAVLGGVVHEGATTQGAASLIQMMKRLPIVGSLTDLIGNRDDGLSRTGSS